MSTSTTTPRMVRDGLVVDIREYSNQVFGGDWLAAIEVAENDMPEGTMLSFPPGNFPCDATHILQKKSGISWLGHRTKLLFEGAASGAPIQGSNGGDFDISGFTFDYSGVGQVLDGDGIPIANPSLEFWGRSRVRIFDNYFKSIVGMGPLLHGGDDNAIDFNRVEVAEDSGYVYTLGIWNKVSDTAPGSPSARPRITRNYLIRCSIAAGGVDGVASGNHMREHSFGGGIYIEQPSMVGLSRDMCQNWLVADNTVRNSVGPDGVLGIETGGIEVGADNSRVCRNYCYRNRGAGLIIQGQGCVISDNVSIENGQGTLPEAWHNAGILLWDQGGTTSSYSVGNGNRCSDGQAVKTQNYGFAKAPGIIGELFAVGTNQFGGNAIADRYP
jgi:hypothetical protein